MDIFLGLPSQSVLAFATASLLIELTPGPNMTWLALVASVEGRRKAFAAVAGVGLGLAIVGLAAAIGVTALLQQSPIAYEILRWGGVAYLLWLAFDGWRGEEEGMSDQEGDGQLMRWFRRGLITNVLNPKAAVFYVAVLPPFLPPQPTLAQSIFLSAIYVLVATGVHGAIAALAGAARPFLADRRRETMVRRTLSILLALVALWFAWKTAR
ncbi:MAG: LysE family translocator [Rhizobiaceae bacterium]